jgi:hypothetical protein
MSSGRLTKCHAESPFHNHTVEVNVKLLATARVFQQQGI